MIDEDATHQTCGDAEKMRAILPAHVLRTDQPHERFIDERRRLQRVVAPFARHVDARQAPQLRFDERDQRLEGVVVAVAPRPEQSGDLCRTRHVSGL